MKIGDLVAWEHVQNDLGDVESDIGVVIKMSRTGSKTESALVQFTDGTSRWYDTQRLVMLNEGR